ncbi:MAG: arginase family protein [Verrucomicrobia bacterium]|nr:arginase family protein [Verrucomicrobiota bacterium]
MISSEGSAVWLALDEAWQPSPQLPRRVELSQYGKQLRFITSKKRIERFYEEFAQFFRPYFLSGSGDFHHLTAAFIRQFKDPFAIVSFDNHPDWDIRPPKWSCGAWVNRALEQRNVARVSVWGCGSFECQLPWRLLGNRDACKQNRLWVAPWRRFKFYPDWLHPISKVDWKQQFGTYLRNIPESKVYVTVDLDCLNAKDAVTNWEPGDFSLDDVTWALSRLRSLKTIIGGDLCGAYSPMRYASRFQELAARFDHPARKGISLEEACTVNLQAYKKIWPALTGTQSV